MLLQQVYTVRSLAVCLRQPEMLCWYNISHEPLQRAGLSGSRTDEGSSFQALKVMMEQRNDAALRDLVSSLGGRVTMGNVSCVVW